MFALYQRMDQVAKGNFIMFYGILLKGFTILFLDNFSMIFSKPIVRRKSSFRMKYASPTIPSADTQYNVHCN